MTTMIKNHTPVQVPPGSGKKGRAAKKKPVAKGFFGLLPDWKIDTQSLKDELRDKSYPLILLTRMHLLKMLKGNENYRSFQSKQLVTT